MKEAAIVRNFAIGLLLAFLIILPAARADENDQATKITFNQAVQLPGRVLPAGTYWFELPRDPNQGYQVRIFNSDRTVLVATFLTIDASRTKTVGTTAFTFTERGDGQPPTVVSWFYPGQTTGHEFIYPKQTQQEFAKEKQVTVVAGD